MTKKSNHKQLQFRLKPACAAVLLALSIHTAQANPLGPTVVNGQASFATGGNTLTITNTPGAIINWQGFSVGANEITRFAQQSASSAVLNRVISNNPSNILGSLQSNGRVFLVNPNGIVFGAGATIDVAGMVASTLNLSNADFLAGRYHFTQVPGAANISNAGNLTTQTGGQIFLIAPNVENAGVITAPNGEILLVAGHSVDLVNTSDPNLRVSITAPAGDATNVGKLIASSGSLGLFGAAVRNSGQVSADSATMQGGKIVFKATKTIDLTGASVVSADGTKGGQIIAKAEENGQLSGELIARGELSAQGEGTPGSGGFIETSAAKVDIRDIAIRTGGGQWLIDPVDVTIQASGTTMVPGMGGTVSPSSQPSTVDVATLQTALANGNSVTIDTAGGTGGTGDITVASAISQTAGGNATLTLQADHDINVNAGIGTAGARFNHNLSLTAGNRIGINSPIYLSDNTLAATAPTIALDALMDVGTGTVRLSSTGTVTQSTTLPAAITAGVLELLGDGGAHTLTHTGNQIGEVKMNTGSVVLTNNGTTLINGFPAPGAGQESVLTAATPVAGELLGGSIAVDGDVMVVGAPGTFMSGQGAAYVYRWNGTDWVFEARLTAPGTINFGTSVTVQGNHVVIGAPETHNGGVFRSGAAYPFVWNGSSWAAGTKLSFSNKVFESEFGSAVTIDGGRLVVGGLGRTSEGGFWTGKIWFYDLESGVWVEKGSARQSDPQFNDYFGANLDISGNRMIVGAPNGPASGTQGKAYIFEFNPATRVWTQTQKLTQTAGVTADFFGGNVSISGDLAVVGATRADPGGKADAGSLYVFRYNGTSWAAEQVLTPSDVTAGDLFGNGARVRDGVIVATSYRADLPGKVDAGAGYVFKYNGTQWLQDAKITATTPVAGDQFGISAALADQRIFFGAYTADPGGATNAGAAYAYDPVATGSTLAGGLTITSAGALTQGVAVDAGGSVSYGSSGNIAINAALNAGANAVTFNSPAAITQTAPITASDLALLGAGGTYVLTNAANSITMLTANTGSVDFSNSGSFAVGDVSVNTFTLSGGTWNQVAATLPGFTVNDFRIAGGTFIRALGGDGSSGTPYQLTDIYGVQGMGSAGMLGNSYALASDIDASATSGWNSGAGFTPVGNSATNFIGIFDGLGHTISNLTINRPATDYVGLFGNAGMDSVIRNVGLLGGSVTGGGAVGALVGDGGELTISDSFATGSVSGNWRVGGLVGSIWRGDITNSYATGNVIGVDYVGGLVGNNSDDSYITNSYATGNAIGVNYVGGLVGNNHGIVSGSHATGNVTGVAHVGGLVGILYLDGGSYAAITDSYATGNVTGTGNHVGGLVGYNGDYYGGGSISTSYATGSVIGANYVGGLVGYNDYYGSVANISDAYATGSVSGITSVGGLVGYNYNDISNVYSTGAVSGTSQVGGLIGENYYTVSSGYWDTQTSGQATSAGGTGLTTAQMMQQASFSGWDFAETWGIDEGASYPYLLANEQIPHSGGVSVVSDSTSASDNLGFLDDLVNTMLIPGNGASGSSQSTIGGDEDRKKPSPVILADSGIAPEDGSAHNLPVCR